MAEGWDRGGRLGKRQEAEWALALPEMLQLVSLAKWRLNPFPWVCPGPAAHPSWWGRLHGAELHCPGRNGKGCVFPCFTWNAAAVRNCCTRASLVPPSFIPDGAGFELLLAAQARLCSAAAPFLFPSSIYTKHMLLLLPQTLPSVEILPFLTMWGKKSLKIGFSG